MTKFQNCSMITKKTFRWPTFWSNVTLFWIQNQEHLDKYFNHFHVMAYKHTCDIPVGSKINLIFQSWSHFSISEIEFPILSLVFKKKNYDKSKIIRGHTSHLTVMSKSLEFRWEDYRLFSGTWQKMVLFIGL